MTSTFRELVSSERLMRQVFWWMFIFTSPYIYTTMKSSTLSWLALYPTVLHTTFTSLWLFHRAPDSRCSHQTIIFMLTDLLSAPPRVSNSWAVSGFSLEHGEDVWLFAILLLLWVFMKLAVSRFLPLFQTSWSCTAGSKAAGEGSADEQSDSFHLCPQKEKKYQDHSVVHQQGKASISEHLFSRGNQNNSVIHNEVRILSDWLESFQNYLCFKDQRSPSLVIFPALDSADME